MSVAELEKVTKHGHQYRAQCGLPHTEEDYRDLVQLLDRLTDEVGEDKNHPLASLMDIAAQQIPDNIQAFLAALRSRTRTLRR
jgi:HTH-type transcriptional regulator/antitoxin HigA